MSCLSSGILARINAQIALKEAQLDTANTALIAALGSGDVESYSFDSKEGEQATKLRSPSVLEKIVSNLENQLNRLYNRRDGRGLVNLNLRRR